MYIDKNNNVIYLKNDKLEERKTDKNKYFYFDENNGVRIIYKEQLTYIDYDTSKLDFKKRYEYDGKHVKEIIYVPPLEEKPKKVAKK